MNGRKLLAAWMVAATLLIGGGDAFADAFGHAFPGAEDREERSDREADLYEEGTDAIDDQDWDEAISAFKRVAEMNGSRADGALYWMAYALNKSGRRAEAMQTIEGLKKNYPKSKWIDDAKALELEARQGRGERVAPERLQDDDLKMIAINSLMHSDPEKAYPLLEKIVRGSSDKKIKERALFILAQSPSQRAQTLIADIARGNANPDLQRTAVKYIGIHGGAKSRAVLSELYSSGSREVKKEVLHAFMLSNDKERVLNAAKAEKDARLREEAIHLLGVMNARSEL
ncbi:MAG TPA: HEAT repeat domain-containing protein, partial [Pyrinomonadaceae bacterium]